MISIKVGSKNQAKLDAVAEILKDYAHLEHADIVIDPIAPSDEMR